MITIRSEQMKKFSEAASKRFEDLMVVHLSKYFPNQCKAAGEAELRRTIRYGVKRAASYKIKAQRDVSRYIDLMMVLGNDFDADGRLPWAAEILAKKTVPPTRMRALLGATLNFLKQSRRSVRSA